MKEFLCQWWPLLAFILLGLLTSILWDIEIKKDVATSLGRLPDDPDDVMNRLEYKGRKYVKMWPSGACFTEEFYNYMRPNNKKKIDMKPDKIYINPEYDLYRTQKNPPFEETYIRKDYLLKWLNKELDRLYEMLPDASNDSPSQIELRHLGQYMQTEKLIDKLNEI